MAELVLYVGNNPDLTRYQDGDIVCAFNRRRIRACHAESICHVKHVPLNREGLNPSDSLPVHWFESTHQFKFQRVLDTVVRTNLITNEVDVIGKTPNAKGEYMNVDLFLKRRLKNPTHRIFGTPGSEFWYGGTIDASNTKLDRVWAKIEELTPKREADFQLWPLSDTEKKHFLTVLTDDFDDEQASIYETPVLGEAGNIAKKRQYKVDYANIADITARVPVETVRDKAQSVDIRFPAVLPISVVGRKS